MLCQQLHRAEADLAGRCILEEHGERSDGCVSEICEMSENHEVFPPGLNCESKTYGNCQQPCRVRRVNQFVQLR